MNSLYDAVAKVCPIDGVSVGDPSDKETWRIDYSASATDAQKTAAISAVAAFDVDAVEQLVLSQELMAQFTADDAANQSSRRSERTVLAPVVGNAGTERPYDGHE